MIEDKLKRIEQNYGWFKSTILNVEAETQLNRLKSQLSIPRADIEREGITYTLYLEKVRIEHESRQKEMWVRYDRIGETK